MTEPTSDQKHAALAAELDYWANLINHAGTATAGTVIAPRLKQLDRDDLVALVGLAVITHAKQIEALTTMQKEMAEILPDIIDLAADIDRDDKIRERANRVIRRAHTITEQEAS